MLLKKFGIHLSCFLLYCKQRLSELSSYVGILVMIGTVIYHKELTTDQVETYLTNATTVLGFLMMILSDKHLLGKEIEKTDCDKLKSFLLEDLEKISTETTKNQDPPTT